MYSTRTCDSIVIKPCLERFDDIQSYAVENIVGAALDPLARAQASLPVSKGGLGLRKASLHSYGAYLSSIVQTKATVDLFLPHFPHRQDPQILLRRFIGALSPLPQSAVDDLSSLDPSHFTQAKLSLLTDIRLQTYILFQHESNDDKRSIARLRSLSLAHSSEYLNSVPSRYFGLAMLPQNFRLTPQYRLGIPVYPTRDPICPACATPMDVYGDHSLACSTENERICRHDALRDAIFEQASHAGLFPKKEARSLIPDS